MREYESMGDIWDEDEDFTPKPLLTDAQKRARNRKARGTSCTYRGERFALLESYAQMPNPNKKFSAWPVHLALVELSKKCVYPTRIRQSDKAIRQIVILEWSVPTKGVSMAGRCSKARRVYIAEVSRLQQLVDKFDKAWPLHFMLKEWPLPYALPWYRANKFK